MVIEYLKALFLKDLIGFIACVVIAVIAIGFLALVQWKTDKAKKNINKK